MTGTGLERGMQVAVECPACSPATAEVHEVLKPGDLATVRCLECDHVHKVDDERSATIDVRAVISSGGTSERTTVSVPQDEQLVMGEEFVATVDGAPTGVRITSLELDGGERSTYAMADEITTIWTRAVDNVVLKATIHGANGGGADTQSEEIPLPGDVELTVGERIPHYDEPVSVDKIVLRDDAVSYERDSFQHQGDVVLAKDVKRLYATRTDGDSWKSPWE